jgi:predicted nucleic acid-binding protein
MTNKSLVLDANILIRAVLGTRVRRILEDHAEGTSFFVPESAYLEAEGHLAGLVVKRGGDPEKALRLLRSIAEMVDVIEVEAYSRYEAEALRRIGERDPDDWPILACALAFGCPIWTEDTDFFGCPAAWRSFWFEGSNAGRACGHAISHSSCWAAAPGLFERPVILDFS